MTTPSKKRLALAIIDFLSSSLNDGTVPASDRESIEVAQSCIADTFAVDPTDQTAMADALGGQNLLAIYGVYEKLKGKSTASTTGASSASEGKPSTPTVGPKDPPSGAGAGATRTTAEAENLKGQGNSAMAKKDYKSAIDLYTRALEITPLNPIYLSNRAAAYSASHQHDLARTDAEMAVAADPKYTKAWSRLGLASFALGDARGSMEAYGKGIEYEGNGGSDAMKKGYETAKKRVEELGAGGMEEDDDAEGDDVGAPSGGAPAAGAGGAGGMPDLSALAGMFGGGGGAGGGGGGPDLSQLMNNPMFSSMAQNLMSNPQMMQNLMSNPRLRDLASSFTGGGGGGGAGAGGGAGRGEGGAGGGGGGMPDLAGLMQDPSIAEMARNMMGGGRGAGGAPPS
ncbi:MAG: hypothetical protein M1827_003228 [Pycnora praestabilis]|nr:MAG: hypothetical protein M1827_003228 [Pycnora praestabilis]